MGRNLSNLVAVAWIFSKFFSTLLQGSHMLLSRMVFLKDGHSVCASCQTRGHLVLGRDLGEPRSRMVISRWSFPQVDEDCARAGRDWLLTSCCGRRRRRNLSHLVAATWRFSKVSSTLLQGSQLFMGLEEKLFWLALPKFSASPPASKKLKTFSRALLSCSQALWPAAEVSLLSTVASCSVRKVSSPLLHWLKMF